MIVKFSNSIFKDFDNIDDKMLSKINDFVFLLQNIETINKIPNLKKWSDLKIIID